MHQFNISIGSFRQVQAFVKLAAGQPFEVLVGNEKHQVHGKNFFSMFSLDLKRPVCVQVNCSQEEFLCFQQEAVKI